MTVFRRQGSKFYYYEFEFNGDRYKASTGQTTKRDAEEVETKLKRTLRRRAQGLEAEDASDTPSFNDWALVTHRYQVQKKELKRPDEAQNTLRMVLGFWGAKPKTKPVAGGLYLNLRLGDPISHPELIEDFERWMTTRKLSGSRKNHYRSACSMLYRVALLPANRRLSGVRENPFAFIERSKTKRRTATLTEAQLEGWISSAPLEVAVLVTLGALAPALRFGSIVDLTYAEHVAPDLSYLNVPHKADKETGLPLTVAVPKSVQALIKALQKRYPGDPHVVPAPDTGRKGRKGRAKPLRYWVFERMIKESIKGAGLPYGKKLADGVTFHSLRHTLQTWMSRWGLQKHEQQRGMAHSTSAMTEWYSHFSGVDTLPAARAIEQRIGHLARSTTKRIKMGGKLGGRAATNADRSEGKKSA